MIKNRQVFIFLLLLLLYSLSAFLTYAFGLQNQAIPEASMPEEFSSIPGWQMGLGVSISIMVIYGLAGLAGIWFTRKLNLPGIYQKDAGWNILFFQPLMIGSGLGLLLTVSDRIFSMAGNWEGFTHPQFPLSFLASLSAGIGEEIFFRLLIMNFWAFLFNLILKRWNLTRTALWIGNIIAALAFSAGHLPSIMYLYQFTTPLQIPPLILFEVFLLNGILAVVCGERFIKHGFVAAAGIHFWADILWHVILPPLLSLV